MGVLRQYNQGSLDLGSTYAFLGNILKMHYKTRTN